MKDIPPMVKRVGPIVNHRSIRLLKQVYQHGVLWLQEDQGLDLGLVFELSRQPLGTPGRMDVSRQFIFPTDDEATILYNNTHDCKEHVYNG